MRPIEFPEANTTYAVDQPEYRPLPVYRASDGGVTSCWALTWRERLSMLLSGRFYISVLTFSQPLQPILPSVEPPEMPQAYLKRGARA